MSEKNIKKSVVSGFFWRFAERCGAQGVGFVVSLILARLLAPELFGVVALITVFTSILQVFVDSGLGSALVQKKDADDLDFSTVFYFNFTMCTVLYALMFFFAPFIDKVIYNGKYENLTDYIRVLSLTLIISGVKNIQHAYVSRKMIFKRFFFATLGGTIIAAFVGIYMAFKGYGVWAIITQNLVNKTIDTCILWITVKWRPRLMFSFRRLKGLLSYGWKLLCSSLLDTIYNNIRQLLIGRVYTSESLSFYNRGKQFPEVIIENVVTSIDSVLFPAMSKSQDNKNNVKLITRRSITVSSYIIWPMMMGIASTSNQLVKLILGDNWLPCVPFLCIFCINFAFRPLHAANLNAIKAMGRSDIFLKLEIIKKTAGFILLFLTLYISVYAMAISLLISNVINQVINSWPNRKLLGYTYFEQLKDILPSIVISFLMAVIVYTIGLIKLPLVVLLIIQIFAGIVFYIGFSYLIKDESFYYVFDMIKKFFNSRFTKNK
ncbi:MAG: lipopolysaccharide biosynthesis protein [Clostridia bacterium]|nr:lipopolysaccharide biosynthesis protein [Clostridia bacterium]